jgi:hypothetical protein
MGIFQKFVNVYNRAPVKLYVMFDGQREPLEPGENELPDLTVMFAKNQNPIMGSQDPNDPSANGARYLIVAEGEPGYGVPLTKDEWEAHCKRPCRIDEEAAFAEQYSNDPKARLVLRNPGRKSTAGSRFEAAASVKGLAAFSNK